MRKKLKKSGIDIIGDVPWGTHLCQFYQTKQDLIDILVPYFKAGLENNEFCLWITSEPLNVEGARVALKKAVKRLDYYIKKGQIKIIDYSKWYHKSGKKLDLNKVLEQWVIEEEKALKKSYDGIRVTGNTFWLEKKDWKRFKDYEETINSVINKYKIIAICSYCLDKCNASDIIDIVYNHGFALIKKNGKWKIIESAEQKKTENDLHDSEEKYRTLIENIYDIIVYMDNKGIVNYISPQVSRYGYKPEEIISKNFLDFIYQDDKERVFQEFKKVLVTGEEVPTQFRVIDKIGGIHWFEEHSKVVRDASNKIVGIISIMRDITKRKESEKLLQESEEFNKALFEYNPIETLVVDLEGRVVDFNQAKRNSGSSLPKLGGVMYRDYASKHKNNMYAELMKCIRSSKSEEFPEQRYGEKVLSINISPFSEGAIITSQDITKRKKAEDSLRESERKYRELIDLLPHGVFEVDTKGNLKFVSGRGIEITGYTKDDFEKGLNFLQMFVPEDRERVIKNMHNTLNGEKSSGNEYTALRKDGSIYHALIYYSPIIYKNEPIGLRGIVLDITEMKIKEKSLRENEERFRSAFNNVNTGMFLVDLKGNLLKVNNKMCEIFGYSKDELEDMSINDITYPDDLNISPEFTKKTISGGIECTQFEKRYFHKNGHIIWGQVSSSIIRDYNGNPLYFVSQLQDITKHKHMDEMLKKSEEKLRMIFSASPYAITVTDLNGNIIECNQETLNLHKFSSKEELIGKSVFDLIVLKDHEKSLKNMEKTLKEGYLKNIEYTFIDKYGQEFPAELSASVINDSSGSPISLVAVTKDITEHKKMQQMLIQSEKMASIGVLAASISHEISNPIQYIYSNLEMLLEYYEKCRNFYESIDKLFEEYVKDEIIFDKFLKLKNDVKIGCLLKDIKDSVEGSIIGVEKIIKITNDLKEFARDEKPKKELADINQGLENALNIVGNELKYKAEIIKEFDNIPKIQCDLQRLEQVFINMLINSAQATEKCGIIKIKTFSKNSFAIIQISDTGKGIPKEHISKIFDPFYTTKAPGRGTGLGLSISYKIIQDHNGEIDVDSKIGKGTTFTIRLPL